MEPKPCDVCGKLLQSWEQFGAVGKVLCWSDYRAEKNDGQLELPIVGDKPRDLWDVANERR